MKPIPNSQTHTFQLTHKHQHKLFILKHTTFYFMFSNFLTMSKKTNVLMITDDKQGIN